MRRALLLLLASLCSCVPVTGPAEITLGTGYDTFAPLADGDRVVINRGPQGGHHIWAAARASRGLDPVQIQLVLHMEKDGVEINDGPVWVTADLLPRGELNELVGFRAYVPVPEDIVQNELVLRLVAIDREGRTAEDQRLVIPSFTP